jgi:hypothetical protein
MSAATAAASPEAYSAAVPAKATVPSATMSPATMSPAAMSSAAMSSAAMSSAAMSSAATAAGVCFECEKRHDDEHHRGHASAGRQHQLHGAAALGAPHRRGQLSLAISPRTKSF